MNSKRDVFGVGAASVVSVEFVVPVVSVGSVVLDVSWVFIVAVGTNAKVGITYLSTIKPKNIN